MVAAMRSDQGASRQLLIAALDRAVVALASVPLMLEYEAVLTRPEHLDQIGLTREEMNAVLDALCRERRSGRRQADHDPSCRKPGDPRRDQVAR